MLWDDNYCIMLMDSAGQKFREFRSNSWCLRLHEAHDFGITPGASNNCWLFSAGSIFAHIWFLSCIGCSKAWVCPGLLTMGPGGVCRVKGSKRTRGKLQGLLWPGQKNHSTLSMTFYWFQVSHLSQSRFWGEELDSICLCGANKVTLHLEHVGGKVLVFGKTQPHVSLVGMSPIPKVHGWWWSGSIKGRVLPYCSHLTFIWFRCVG